MNLTFRCISGFIHRQNYRSFCWVNQRRWHRWPSESLITLKKKDPTIQTIYQCKTLIPLWLIVHRDSLRIWEFRGLFHITHILSFSFVLVKHCAQVRFFFLVLYGIFVSFNLTAVESRYRFDFVTFLFLIVVGRRRCRHHVKRITYIFVETNDQHVRLHFINSLT